MVLSRKQCRMLLDSAAHYEGRHGRNAQNSDHRGAKNRLEQFLASTNPCFQVMTSRDLSWFQEWLSGRDLHGNPLWNALYTQIDFACYYG